MLGDLPRSLIQLAESVEYGEQGGAARDPRDRGLDDCGTL